MQTLMIALALLAGSLVDAGVFSSAVVAHEGRSGYYAERHAAISKADRVRCHRPKGRRHPTDCRAYAVERTLESATKYGELAPACFDVTWNSSITAAGNRTVSAYGKRASERACERAKNCVSCVGKVVRPYP